MTTCYQLLAGALPTLATGSSTLRQRVETTSWPASLDGSDGKSGMPAEELQLYADAWCLWLQQPEPEPLGQHRLLDIEGQRLHVVCFVGRGQHPLLMLHGWPTSFLAFHRVIEPLSELFSEIVLGSLPGFGGSTLGNAHHTIEETARYFHEAMAQLGHEHFIVHGEDWGSVVAREIGRQRPGSVLGVHVSAGLHGFMAGPNDTSPPGLDRFLETGGAYLQLQSQRPGSLDFALSDSPVGLLAWHLDKFALWQEELGDHFGLGLDFILANATLYWLTSSIGSSMRIYSANAKVVVGQASTVPTGVSVFRYGDYPSRPASERQNNLVAWYEHDHGGHVAALDATDHLTRDLNDFVHRVGSTTE